MKDETKSLIMTHSQLRDFINRAPAELNVLVHGAPGLGKSAAIEQAADDLGMNFCSIRAAEMERADIAGCLVPQTDKTGKMRSVYALSSLLPTAENTLVFIDEILNCAPDLQGSLFELLQERRLAASGYILPANCRIIGAGNDAEDSICSQDLAAPMANRFVHIWLEADVDSWSSWALSHGISPTVVGFVNFRPALLHKVSDVEPAWPSPRSWEMVSKLEAAGLAEYAAGAVGTGAGTEYLAFARNAQAIGDIAKMVKTGVFIIPKRDDQQVAYATALVVHAFKKDVENSGEKFLAGIKELPADMRNLAVRLVMNLPLAERTARLMEIRKAKAFPEFAKAFSLVMKGVDKEFKLDL